MLRFPNDRIHYNQNDNTIKIRRKCLGKKKFLEILHGIVIPGIHVLVYIARGEEFNGEKHALTKKWNFHCHNASNRSTLSKCKTKPKGLDCIQWYVDGKMLRNNTKIINTQCSA